MKDGFRVIDGDAHMQEPLDIWERYVEPGYRERAPKVIGAVARQLHNYGPCEPFPEGIPQRRPESLFAGYAERYGPAYESWWDLPSRLQHMEQEGIDLMIGFPTNGRAATSRHISDPRLQAALCRAYNDWATDFCSGSHGRVKFIAKVTLLDVAEAVAEVKRVGARPEVAGIVLPDPGTSRL